MIIIILGALWRFHRVVKKNQLLLSFLSRSFVRFFLLLRSRRMRVVRWRMSFIGTIAERPRSGTCPAPPLSLSLSLSIQSRGCVFNWFGVVPPLRFAYFYCRHFRLYVRCVVLFRCWCFFMTGSALIPTLTFHLKYFVRSFLRSLSGPLEFQFDYRQWPVFFSFLAREKDQLGCFTITW